MKNQMVFISLIVSLFFGVLCYKAWIAAFVVTKLLSDQTDGKQGIIKSIIIPWWNYQLHLHHWFLVLISGIVE
jgi:surface polysaccharide O-acyltransferase-like enzyme